MPDILDYRLPDSLPEEIERVCAAIAGFRSGELSADQFKRLRVLHGIYEQRQAGTYMIRVRLPAGMVRPRQMRTLAEVAERHGSGRLHLTTRQDVQIHNVAIDHLYAALCELYASGLSSLGGGGNSVRNIVACPNAGVCFHEAFDVTQTIVSLTERILRDPESFALPRKLKIAFSGCARDCAGATVSDIGFIAHRDPDAYFSVHVGGGLGQQCRIADRLEDRIAPEECSGVTEAIKRVFIARGNREDRKRARLRFLVEELGIDEFRNLYEEERHSLGDLRLDPLPPVQLTHRIDDPGDHDELTARRYERWRDRNTAPQSMPGFHLVQIPVFLGDLTASQFRDLADVVERFGERHTRVSSRQNLVLRWVAATELPALFAALEVSGLLDLRAPIIRDIVSCTGPDTCQLGVCASRAAATAISQSLEQSGLPLWDTAVRIHISGCQNSCGRHPVASIGLYGVARRVNGVLVPHYVVQFGGRLGEGRTRLAQGSVAIPARRIAPFITELMRSFATCPAYPVFDDYLQDYAFEVAALLEKHRTLPPYEQDPLAYCDLGSNEPFSLETRGVGECSGG